MTAAAMLLPAFLQVAAENNVRDTIYLDEVCIIHQEPLQDAGMLTEVMDSLSIRQMQGRSLAELLSLRSALHVKSTGRGALSTIAFRGTDASHTKVYWNGIRINSPMTGQVDFSLIPVVSLDALSLLYGGSSLTEGSGAFGGAILLENTIEQAEGFSMDFHQETGSFGTSGTSLVLGAGNRLFRSETSLYHDRSRNDYLYYNTDVIPRTYEKLGSASYRLSGLLQEFSFRPWSGHQIEMHVWLQDAFRELPPVMSFEGSGREETQQDRNMRSSLEWSYYSPAVKLKFRSAFMVSGMWYDLDHTGIDYVQYRSRSHERSILTSLGADITPRENTRLRFRADMNSHFAGISETVRDLGYDYSRKEVSLLAGVYQQAGNDLMLYSLLRLDRTDQRWLSFMPSAGFRYKLSEKRDISLKGSVCRNYNLPSLNDLYWVPGGNPALRPEKGVNADLGLTYSYSGTQSEITSGTYFFAAWVEDWIVWRPTAFRYWEPGNLARVFSRGVESRLVAKILWNRVEWTISGNYSFTRSTNEGSTGVNDHSRGRQLIYIPVHSAHMYHHVSFSKYFACVSLAHTGRQYTQPSDEAPDFTVSLNPYVLVDFCLGRDVEMGRHLLGVQAGVCNLLNQHYQAVVSRPMPLRSFALSIRWKIR